MDSILETPTKRRKTNNGHVPGEETYNSQDDSGDDLFNGHETVATVPLPLHTVSQPSYITQPTQIFGRDAQTTPSHEQKPPIVQVAASSPARTLNGASSSPSVSGSKSNHYGIANMMAPAGK